MNYGGGWYFNLGLSHKYVQGDMEKLLNARSLSKQFWSVDQNSLLKVSKWNDFFHRNRYVFLREPITLRRYLHIKFHIKTMS